MRIAALLALGLPALASAEEVVWRPAARTPPPVAVAGGSPARPPAASLGRPIAIATSKPAVAQVPVPRGAGFTARAAAPDEGYPPPPPPPLDEITLIKGEPLGKREPIGTPSLPDLGMGPKTHTVSGPPDAPPPPSDNFQPGIITDNPVRPSWWEKTRSWMEWGEKGSITGRSGFQSDHCFESLISPVTNPFYFEDPRSLTEIRPIFMYQGVPNSNPFWNGGDLYFFGTQARLALTERFSIVLHELGFFSFNPDAAFPPIQNGSGFAEVKIGGKYTFLRNPECGAVAAAGLMVEIPAGSAKVFQDTGQASIVPYLSYAQTIYRLPSGFGALNFVGNLGYSFSTDKARSEFFYTNLHLDYNVAGLNAFFPLVEVNWIHYTKGGNNVNLGFEGADLINFGSATRQGRDYVALALGARYRFTNNIQVGAAVQVPVTNEDGLSDYRLTFDLIFRY